MNETSKVNETNTTHSHQLLNTRTNLPLTALTPLTDTTTNNPTITTLSPQTYIYIIENSVKLIKIGQSKNPQQRVQSLSGSNSQGNKITRIYVSEPTYLFNLEKAMHSVFKEYRIKGTEWFKGVTFEEVCMELNEQMNNETYYKLNSLRATFLSK